MARDAAKLQRIYPSLVVKSKAKDKKLPLQAVVSNEGLSPLKAWCDLCVDGTTRPLHSEAPSRQLGALKRKHENSDAARIGGSWKDKCFGDGAFWTARLRPAVGAKIQYFDGLDKRERFEQGKTNQAVSLADAVPLSKIRRVLGAEAPASLLDLALPREQRAALLEVVRRGTALLSCIPYCVIQGSALGVGRDKAIIPWDDDFDLGVPKAYRDEVRFRLANSGSYALSLHSISSGLDRICFSRGGQSVPKAFNGRRLGGDYPWTWPYIDVVYFQNDGQAVCKKEAYPGENVNFDKLSLVDLTHGFSVKVMRSMGAYLVKTYGAKWRTIAKQHAWSHIHNRKTLADETALYSAKTGK